MCVDWHTGCQCSAELFFLTLPKSVLLPRRMSPLAQRLPVYLLHVRGDVHLHRCAGPLLLDERVHVHQGEVLLVVHSRSRDAHDLCVRVEVAVIRPLLLRYQVLRRALRGRRPLPLDYDGPLPGGALVLRELRRALRLPRVIESVEVEVSPRVQVGVIVLTITHVQVVSGEVDLFIVIGLRQGDDLLAQKSRHEPLHIYTRIGVGDRLQHGEAVQRAHYGRVLVGQRAGQQLHLRGQGLLQRVQELLRAVASLCTHGHRLRALGRLKAQKLGRFGHRVELVPHSHYGLVSQAHLR
mmetsp:Transcript_10768/g.23838  ORF Transcript_10768/g.23838 Transcript_10768/m.23838 type:complete len:295 (-) Transcript_10768:1421-2305(-)